MILTNDTLTPHNMRIVINEKDLPGRLEELFFPVQLRLLYWEEEPPLMGPVHVKECDPAFFGVLDVDKSRIFAAVTQGYLLITNQVAYNFGCEIAQILFHTESKDDIKCIHAELSSNRAVCQIDLRSKLDIGQPLMNEGWCFFMRVINSYNKTKKLEYIVGFFNVAHGYGFLDNTIAISANTAHYNQFRSYQMDIWKQIKEKEHVIKQLELTFLSKISTLKQLLISKESILPMFCKVFGIKKTNINSPQHQSLIDTKNYIEKQATDLTQQYGQNAYALLNVFAEYEYKYDTNSLRFLLRQDQFKLGKWVDDLIVNSKAADFSLYNYIGKEAYDAAEWLRTL